MLEAVMKYGIIFYAMGLIFVIGIAAKIISHGTARSMAKAASEIQKSNHRLMRLLKLKFEHASMVSDKVQNVEVFVKKHLYEYKVLGVRLEMWKSMRQKTIWMIVALGVCGIFWSYQIEGMGEQTLHYVAYTGIFAIFLCTVHILSDENVKLRAAENYIIDYLENVCLHRYEKAGMEKPEVEIVETAEKEEVVKEPEINKERESQEMRLRAILEEFLA